MVENLLSAGAIGACFVSRPQGCQMRASGSPKKLGAHNYSFFGSDQLPISTLSGVTAQMSGRLPPLLFPFGSYRYGSPQGSLRVAFASTYPAVCKSASFAGAFPFAFT